MDSQLSDRLMRIVSADCKVCEKANCCAFVQGHAGSSGMVYKCRKWQRWIQDVKLGGVPINGLVLANSVANLLLAYRAALCASLRNVHIPSTY